MNDSSDDLIKRLLEGGPYAGRWYKEAAARLKELESKLDYPHQEIVDLRDRIEELEAEELEVADRIEGLEATIKEWESGALVRGWIEMREEQK